MSEKEPPMWLEPIMTPVTILAFLVLILVQRGTGFPLYRYFYAFIAGPDDNGSFDWAFNRPPIGHYGPQSIVNTRAEICRWEDDGGAVVRLYDAKWFWRARGIGKTYDELPKRIGDEVSA